MTEAKLRKAAPMGNLLWGEGSAGELNTMEKVRVVSNIAYLQVREACDAIRQRTGFLQPRPVALDDLEPPRDALVEDALGLAVQTHQEALLFHSWRVYFFGSLLAAHERIRFDRSLFFASAILHDLGLTQGHSPDLCDCCFALSGGRRARDYLRAKGHPAEVGKRVGDAIALHLNAWVSKKQYGAEAHLVSRGAVCDLFGAGRRRLASETVAKLLERFPREGAIEALRYETAKHKSGTRPALMTALTGGKAPPDPFAHIWSSQVARN
ncbi:HD domain-containing protein [Mesorhizobium sp. CO1-1-8]|uniref:HD domain-containing protein n=1 Tax=Mesorhizobium sp. CO1-1-8 TaxID=2876631 RepID=UPI001CD05A22|nr:HD domain-containing protein [Mesorhizobium sp. CO1-1-8]MBZ9772443.1 HD domain-containing protein [Mesorhizobium sp. CO1-1-8]